MYEVMEYYGNHKYVIKYDKLNDIHPNFLQWLIKRQALLRNGHVFITNPYDQKETYVLTDQLGILGAAQISFTTLTAYPDPDPETTTVDGYILCGLNGSSVPWATLRAGGSALSADDSSTILLSEPINLNTIAVSQLRRSMTLFDTSSIGSGSIDSATFSGYGFQQRNSDNDGLDTIDIIEASPASNTALVSTDFTNFTFTSYASLDITGMSASGYNDFTLSPTTIINKSGVTKLGIIEGHDFSDGTSPGLPSSDNSNFLRFYSADQSGTSNDPKLVVEYTAAGNTTINPSTQVVTLSLPAGTVTGEAQVSVAAQSLSFSLPTETVTADWKVNVNTQVATFSIPAYTVQAQGVSVLPSAQVLSFSLPAETVLGNAIVSPDAQSLTFSIPVSSVKANWQVGVNPVVLTVTLPTLVFVGALWGRTARTTTGADWTRSVKNNDA